MNGALDRIRAKYYFTSVLIFAVVFFAAYNATISLQYWLNPDTELEELHAYLVSANNQPRGRKKYVILDSKKLKIMMVCSRNMASLKKF